jgi:hypothetical protein
VVSFIGHLGDCCAHRSAGTHIRRSEPEGCFDLAKPASPGIRVSSSAIDRKLRCEWRLIDRKRGDKLAEERFFEFERFRRTPLTSYGRVYTVTCA